MLTLRARPTLHVEPRLLAVAAAGFAAFLNLHAPQAMLPTLMACFGARHELVGMTISAATLAIALSSPLAGVVVSRFSRGATLRFCFTGMIVTTLGCAFSASLWTLIGWRFLQGLFIPPILAITMSFIGEGWSAAEVGRIMAFYVSWNVVGGFCGRFLAGIMTAHVHWRAAFGLLAVLNIVSAYVVLRAMPDGGRSAGGFDTLNVAVLARHVRDRRLRSAFAAGFTVLFALVCLFTYVTYYLTEAPFHLRADALGALFAVYLVGVVVTPWAGRLIHPVGHGRVIVGSAILAILGALVTLVPTLPAVLVGLAICSSSAFVCQSAATGYVSEVSGDERASALGLYLSFYYLGGSAGAVVPGFLWPWTGWVGTVALLIVIYAWTIALARGLELRPNR